MAFWRWVWPACKKALDCPFCLLSAGSTEGRTTGILFQDDQIVVFKDRNPACYRFGFHRPPFNSVDHLHLHCMALPYRSWWNGFKYVSLGWLGSYISAETVLKYLDSSELAKGSTPQQDKPEMPV